MHGNEFVGATTLLSALANPIGVTLWLAVPISRLLGKTGINVATRVMALFVAAIGVHFIVAVFRHQLTGLLLGSA